MKENIFQIEGEVVHISYVKPITETMSKREITVSVFGSGNTVTIEFVDSNIYMLETYNEGDNVNITFAFRGNKSRKSGQYFNILNGLNIVHVKAK